MPYTNPKILAKFIQRNLPYGNNVNEKSCIAICKKIDVVLQSGMHQRDIALFKEALQKALKRTPLSIQCACLKGLKDYLHSSDFQPPKKYEKKSKWLIFIEVSETDLLNPIYQCIDELLASNQKKKEVNFVSTTRRMTTGFNLFLFPLALLSTVNMSIAKANSHLSGLNQTPVLPKLNVFDEMVSTCLPVDELPLHYHIVQNAPLRNVTHFFFGENHYHSWNRKLAAQSGLRIGTAGDYFRAERFNFNEELACTSIHENLPSIFTCLGWEEPVARAATEARMAPVIPVYKFHKIFFEHVKASSAGISSKEDLINSLNNSPQVKYYFQRTYQAISRVWSLNLKPLFEIEELSVEGRGVLGKVNTIFEEEVKNLNKMRVLNEKFQVQPTLVRIEKFSAAVEKSRKRFSEINVMLSKYLNVASQSAMSHTDAITGRNRGLEQAINSLEIENQKRIMHGMKPRKQFYITGWSHLFPKRAVGNDDELIRDEAIEAPDPQYPFRMVASKVPSAFLYPRQR